MTLSSYPVFVSPSYFGGSACILLNLSTILFIVAFSSPYWFVKDDSYYVGLWQACYKMPAGAGDGSSTNTTESDAWQCSSASAWISSKTYGLENDWLVGLEAILTISLLFLVLTSIALILYVGSSPMRRQLAQGVVFIGFCFTFAIACFSLTAVIISGVQVGEETSGVLGADLSWSYIIATLSTALNWFCAILLIVEVVRVMAGAPVQPGGASMSAQQSFLALYRSLELQQSFGSDFNVRQNEAVGYENEAHETQNEARAGQRETDAQDGGGHYENPEESLAAAGSAVGNSLYESFGVLPTQFNKGGMHVRSS